MLLAQSVAISDHRQTTTTTAPFSTHVPCVAAKLLASMVGSPLRVEMGVLQPECVVLFSKWKSAGLSKPY